MIKYPEIERIREIVEAADKIVVVQADNPDSDSLSSALALEHILSDLGKEIILYCGVDIPSYLHHLKGYDRVVKVLPNQFDASLIVDNSSDTLLEQLSKTGGKSWLASRPSIIIDHHKTKPTISFASVVCNHPAVSTTEVIYELAGQLKWPINLDAKELIAIGILSDSLGLTTESTSARSIHIIAELVDSGVSLPSIDSARKETLKREPELIHYKGQVLQRVEFHDDNRIATVEITNDEIDKYSPLYNPSMLVLDDMRLAKGTAIAIAFKTYKDGKVTAKIRANYKFGIANKLAEHFGGGGHPYASGFRVTNGKTYREVKNETIKVAAKLLGELNENS